MEAATELRRTPLFAAHEAAGAKLVPFAGWEMPVEYDDLRAEHRAVRSHAGVFDVSHMGEIETEGPDAEAFLQRVLSNDVAKLEIGGAQYSCLCREDGGVLDDLFSYRLTADRYLTVTNASNHESDFEWFTRQAEGFDVRVRDVAADYAMLAVQGPKAREAVGVLATTKLPARFRTELMEVAGATTLVCGTGYTGEDGVELLVPPDEAPRVWSELLSQGVKPAGLGARDSLRLEVCYCLYGNELSTERTPIEASLGWCCKEETGFIGSETVAHHRAEGPEQLLAPFVFTDKGVPRQGFPVVHGEETVGVVTSGSFSPSLDKGIGMAYVRADLAKPGTEIEIDVRGKRRATRVEEKPLYKHETD